MSILIRSPQVDTKVRILSAGTDSPVSDQNAADCDQDQQLQDATVSYEPGDVGATAQDQEKLRSEQKLKQKIVELEKQAADSRNELEQLKAGIEQEHAKAAEQGYSAGYEDGLVAAQKQTAEQVNSLREIIGNLSGQIAALVENEEDLIVETVFAATVKMLGDTVVTKDGILAAVRQVTKQVTQRDQVVIRVSPSDYKVLKQELVTVQGGILEKQPELIADERVQLGGCILETNGGSLDGRLEVQLQALRDLLLAERQKSKAQTA